MEENVQVRCPRCKSVFRERARRLQDGFSRQCVSCESVLFFNDASQDPHIKRAMKDARELRRRLNEVEQERSRAPAPRAFSRTYSGRGTAEGDEPD